MRPEVKTMHDSIEFVERVLVDLDAAQAAQAAKDLEWQGKLAQAMEDNRLLRRQFEDLLVKYKAIDPSNLPQIILNHQAHAAALEEEVRGLAARLLAAKDAIIGGKR